MIPLTSWWKKSRSVSENSAPSRTVAIPWRIAVSFSVKVFFVGFSAGFSAGFAATSTSSNYSTSWVKISEAAHAVIIASTWARFFAIFRTVLYTSAMSGFSTREAVQIIHCPSTFFG